MIEVRSDDGRHCIGHIDADEPGGRWWKLPIPGTERKTQPPGPPDLIVLERRVWRSSDGREFEAWIVGGGHSCLHRIEEFHPTWWYREPKDEPRDAMQENQ